MTNHITAGNGVGKSVGRQVRLAFLRQLQGQIDSVFLDILSPLPSHPGLPYQASLMNFFLLRCPRQLLSLARLCEIANMLFLPTP